MGGPRQLPGAKCLGKVSGLNFVSLWKTEHQDFLHRCRSLKRLPILSWGYWLVFASYPQLPFLSSRTILHWRNWVLWKKEEENKKTVIENDCKKNLLVVNMPRQKIFLSKLMNIVFPFNLFWLWRQGLSDYTTCIIQVNCHQDPPTIHQNQGRIHKRSCNASFCFNPAGLYACYLFTIYSTSSAVTDPWLCCDWPWHFPISLLPCLLNFSHSIQNNCIVSMSTYKVIHYLYMKCTWCTFTKALWYRHWIEFRTDRQCKDTSNIIKNYIVIIVVWRFTLNLCWNTTEPNQKTCARDIEYQAWMCVHKHSLSRGTTISLW